MVVQGDVFWADLPTPRGSGPGYRRPVLVVQSDDFNLSRIRTIVCVPLTTNVGRAASPGNVLLPAEATGLDYDSVANVSLIAAWDRTVLLRQTGNIGRGLLEHVFAGIDTVLGR